MNKKILLIFFILISFSFFIQKTSGQISIVINEFIPNPEGVDKENEWIEIRNLNNNEVDLNNWKLKDKSEKEYIIKEKISPFGYLVFPIQETKISINNQDEILYLLTPDNKISSKIGFNGSSKEGYSFSRKGKNDWQWTSITTPGKENIFPEDLNTKEENIQKENTQDIFKKEVKENELANVSNKEYLKESENYKMIGLVILIGIVFSFISALFIRKYLK